MRTSTAGAGVALLVAMGLGCGDEAVGGASGAGGLAGAQGAGGGGGRSGSGGDAGAAAGGSGGLGGGGAGPCASDAACAAERGAGALCVGEACTAPSTSCTKATLVTYLIEAKRAPKVVGGAVPIAGGAALSVGGHF